jgi:hypothetical protein
VIDYSPPEDGELPQGQEGCAAVAVLAPIVGWALAWLIAAALEVLGRGSGVVNLWRGLAAGGLTVTTGVSLGWLKYKAPLLFARAEVLAGLGMVARTLATELKPEQNVSNFLSLLAASYFLAKGTEGVLKNRAAPTSRLTQANGDQGSATRRTEPST